MADIYSFDRTEKIECEVFRPDRYRKLFSDLKQKRVISRGGGLNYCMASGVDGGKTILTKMFNRFLSFDATRKIVRVESGVTLGKLFEFSYEKNLLPPVLAGYPQITVGGAVAMNIHGKNQFRMGNFCDHVLQLTLYHPRYGEFTCSPKENAKVYWLTIGGFGLTGHIVSVDIALQPLANKIVLQERQQVSNLLDAAKLMEEYSGSVDYSYSWHDLNQSGSKFGRGTIYLERYTRSDEFLGKTMQQPKRKIHQPMIYPVFNHISVPLMCKIYDFKENLRPRSELVDLFTALFPIVGKEIYFSLFGKRGFREYQTLIPTHKWNEAAEHIQFVIQRYKVPISLASLKIFKGERKYLNFNGEGICLAIDTPNNEKNIKLFEKIDEIVIENEGISNISKDSRLNLTAIQRMYQNQYENYRKDLKEYDPEMHFYSELRRRINV